MTSCGEHAPVDAQAGPPVVGTVPGSMQAPASPSPPSSPVEASVEVWARVPIP